LSFLFLGLHTAVKRAGLEAFKAPTRFAPSVPTSLETVAPRYLCTDGRRMVPQACPSHPKFLVERPPLPMASASGMSRV
jgi:hypothetical protein